MRPRIVYCHGFGSSGSSPKAAGLREALGGAYEFVAPDLNLPSFERLRWASMVSKAAEEAAAAPTAVIVGSSLGSLVALEASRRVPAPLVLLAPVLGYGPVWTPPIPEGDPVRFWDAHQQRERSFHRAFVEELWAHAPETEPPPAAVTVVMGRKDASISFDLVRGVFDRWVRSGRLAARSEFLDLPDGDHLLTGLSDVVADVVRRRARTR